jgi:hypothetical protein
MNFLTLRRPRSGRLEGRTALTQVTFSVVTVSSVVNLADDCVQRHLWGMARLSRG